MQRLTETPIPADDMKAEFQFRIRELEIQLDEVQNLYISSSQLLRSLEPKDVIEAVREILLNLVGAVGFDVSIVEGGGRYTSLIAGERPGSAAAEMQETWDQQRAFVLDSGQTVFVNTPGLIAVIPLKAGDNVVGVLSIFDLLSQKTDGLSSRDVQVLEFLATHAASALVCAALYQRHAIAVGDCLRDLKAD